MHTAKNSGRKVAILAGISAVLALFTACAPKPIHVRMPDDPKLLAAWPSVLAQAVPDADVRWNEPGEVDLEIADSWDAFQKRRDEWDCATGALPPALDEAWVDAQGCFAAVWMALEVIAYDTRAVPPRELPERWRDLDLPKWRGKVGLALEGLEKGNFPLATIFLDEVLAAQKRGAPVRALYPLDGVHVHARPAAVRKNAKYPKIARQVLKALFSAGAQNVVVRAGYYSAIRGMAYPDGARSWDEVKRNAVRK